MSQPDMLAVTDLRKTFGTVTAVAGVSFSVHRGECFALLGPNGAGKTTTLSMIASLLKPDGGTIHVDGHDAVGDSDAVRRLLGVVPQELSVYDRLTARENLAFFGGLYGLRGADLAGRVAACLALAGLDDRADHRVDTFSGGMKRRLNVAVGLIHRPTLVLLDEPTVGVDPQSRNHLFDMVEQLKRDGVTLIYTTHYMEEAERLCDRVGIIDRGRVVGLGTRTELVKQIGADAHAGLTFPSAAPPSDSRLALALAGFEFAPQPGGVCVRVPDATALQRVLARCTEHGIELQSVLLKNPDLESVFLALTGRALRDQ